jgi:CheY-like chemotaxis protein
MQIRVPARPPGTSQVSKSAATGRVRPRPPAVLVVDDFGSARELYARVFRSSGFDVAEASSGAEALETGIALRPDLIVVDLAMPGMDGLETIRRFRKDPGTRNSRIVVVTGAAFADGARKAKEAGCDAYLVKPCLPQTLLSVVRSLLGDDAALTSPRGRRPHERTR